MASAVDRCTGRFSTWPRSLLVCAFLGALLQRHEAVAGEPSYEVLVTFGAPRGEYPESFIRGSDGIFYGTTSSGGAEQRAGTVFEFTPESGLSTLASFQGLSSTGDVVLIEASDGTLYGGTTRASSGTGSIFQFTRGSGLATLHEFFESMANLRTVVIEGSDGSFYATTWSGGELGRGRVLRFRPGSEPETLHSFSGDDGMHPASLVETSDGVFYGLCHRGGETNRGTVFRFTLGSGGGPALTTVHSFQGGDGTNPWGLIDGRDGMLYGVCFAGGDADQGTVFQLTPGESGDSGLSTLHSFQGGDGTYPWGLVQGGDGDLYGFCRSGGDADQGTIFRLDAGAGVDSGFTVFHSFAGGDGSHPTALADGADGSLYGTTREGGNSGRGTIFRFTPGSGPGSGFVTLHSFEHHEGAPPLAGVVEGSDGSLYGTTCRGGGKDVGTIFRFQPGSSDDAGFTHLHSFQGSDGAYPFGTSQMVTPFGSLVKGSDGNLYGTTLEGDRSIFRFAPGPGVDLRLTTYPAAVGQWPSGLLEERAGTFYGVTFWGGTIFKFTPGSGADFSVDVLEAFRPIDGQYPLGGGPFGLVRASDGGIYGTTSQGGGGPNGAGTIFRFTPDQGVDWGVTAIHSFQWDGPHWPKGLVAASDGSVYGSAVGGGGTTIFRLAPPDWVPATFHTFEAGQEGWPIFLVEGSDGNLYGTSPGGGAAGRGSIFRLTPAGSVGSDFTRLHSFDGTHGERPQAALFQASDGRFYGTASGGGNGGSGVLFRLDVGLGALHRQVPGDCNQDGDLDISDAVCLLGFLFLGAPDALPCGGGRADDAANVGLLNFNGDADGLDLSDAVAMLTHLFSGGPPHVLGRGCVSVPGCPNGTGPCAP